MSSNALAGPSSAGASRRPPSPHQRGDTTGARRRPQTKDGEDNQERCCICLMGLVDRTAVGCGHQFCFKCIGVWANQSRRCPLCNAEMGAYLEHDLGSSTPTKFFLPPLPQPFSTSRPPLSPTRKAAARAEVAALTRRREIYARGLWAKHIGSTGYTGFRANPSPRDMASDGASAKRARTFLRRELRVWYDNGGATPASATPAGSAGSSPRGVSDIDRVADHITSLLTCVDIRSSVAVSLLHPLVGSYAHAQHLAHELYCFLRSPFAELEDYDAIVTYSAEGETYPEVDRFRRRRESLTSTIDSRSSRSWDSRSRSRSRSRSPSRSRSRSRSRSFSSVSSSSSYSLRRRRSRSRSESRDRDYSRPDTFVPAPSRGERRWDQPDSWVDPDYARELAAAEKRRKRKEQRTRQRERRREAQAEAEAAAGRRGEKGEKSEKEKGKASAKDEKGGATLTTRALAGAGIVIRGAAERRQSLLERLAKARGEASVAAAGAEGSASPSTSTASNGAPALLARISGSPGVVAEPKGEAPAKQSQSPPAASSTDKGADERASELRARLIAERKRKVLREQLMARKRVKTSPEKEKREGTGAGSGPEKSDKGEEKEVEEVKTEVKEAPDDKA